MHVCFALVLFTGDILEVVCSLPENPSGVVYRVTRDRVTIAFDELPDGLGGPHSLIKIANEMCVMRRMRSRMRGTEIEVIMRRAIVRRAHTMPSH